MAPLSQVYCVSSQILMLKISSVNEYNRPRHSLAPNSVSVPPLVSAPPFIYLQSFKLDFNDLKHKVGLLKIKKSVPKKASPKIQKDKCFSLKLTVRA